MKKRPSLLTLSILLLVVGATLVSCAAVAEGDDFAFTSPDEDTQRFMAWYESIELSDAQEQVMKDALVPLPAPCCSDNSAYTCCCPCNLAKTWWGLSKHLIADRDAGAEEVRGTVEAWFERVNPDGFSGDICGTGGCNRAFKHNGCGGMSAARVSV